MMLTLCAPIRTPNRVPRVGKFNGALTGNSCRAPKLSDAVRFFHLDALSSTVGLKIDFDMVLLVLASGLYRILAKTMRGYSDAQARQIFRDLVDIPADVTITAREIQVSFHRRSHLPILLDSGLFDKPIAVPWWNGLKLRLTTYNGPQDPKS